ncbi:hypothetical protein PYCCODRAFT_423978 [Trametes coccinea BRFM310]|uniref:Uncharacterized protein n=1 Tax=Trametes coccinea (strain BRFM310) TaxID=1353009 RepID=A0A1Y2IME2_TRAC3|nr:hypothetical protein PYCCODRAFT_423978 [Trametes coccinea BRFM310]
MEIKARPILLKYGRYFTFEDGQSVRKVNATQCDGHVKYGWENYRHVLVNRCTEPKEWNLASTYSWGGHPLRSRYSNPPIKFTWDVTKLVLPIGSGSVTVQGR